MNTELAIVDPKQFGLEEAKAKEITSGLSVYLSEREILIEQYKSVINLEITNENLNIFKDLRLKIVKNRTQGILAWHKVNKEFYLRGGQFVDAIKNREILVNEGMEEKLGAAEKYFENLEKEKIAQLQLDRVEMLRPYEVENLEQLQLGTMDLNVFDSFLLGVKTSFEAKKEREAKALKEKEDQDALIEQKRKRNEILLQIDGVKMQVDSYYLRCKENEDFSLLADFKNILFCTDDEFNASVEEFKSVENANNIFDEAQRLENERLKKEAEEMEKELEAEKKRAEEKAKADKEKADKILADQKAKADAILEAERKEKARIEKELQDKKDAEAKEEQAKKDAEEKAKKDAEKLAKQSLQKQRQAWIDRFAMPETELSDVKTKEIQARFAGFITWATQTNNQ